MSYRYRALYIDASDTKYRYRLSRSLQMPSSVSGLGWKEDSEAGREQLNQDVILNTWVYPEKWVTTEWLWNST